MAKKKSTVSQVGKLTGKSVMFVGKFGYGGRDLPGMRKLADAEGATVLEGDKSAPDYLVAGTGVGGNAPAAVAKIQNKYPEVQVIDAAGFYQLVNPTPDECVEYMKSRTLGHVFWSELSFRLGQSKATIDLSGTDFRNQHVDGTFYCFGLDNCDFRGAKISGDFPKVTGAKFDDSHWSEGGFSEAEDCSLTRITMNRTRWNPAQFIRCDFSGAKLDIDIGSYTTATDCVFKNADLSGGRLEHSKFHGSDFSGANLSETKLQQSDFTNAQLSGADLSRADLRGVLFVNADLRKVKFHDAKLSGADFTGAKIDGADFADAILTDVKLDGVDISKAKNLVQTVARTIGSNMQELTKVALASHKFSTSIELNISPHESATIYAQVQRYGTRAYANAKYQHESPGNSLSSNIISTTFEQCMLDLADMWSRGKPDFQTVKVEAKKCPLRGQELKDLAIAAWHEACGLAVPSPEELKKVAQQSASETASLRETMIAELHAGSAGVKKWNERPSQDRAKLGKLRKHDFSNANLKGAHLDSQDLEGCNFADANLIKAYFNGAQLKGVDFSRANLTGANMASAKPADAIFAGAKVIKCNLRVANFLRTNFRNADLTGSDFSFASLNGADFTGATLIDVEFHQTKFDESTIFPPGFVLPEGLLWKGTGPRPGAAPLPPAPPVGSLTFDDFIQRLNKNVEAARMEKAADMLKAERFQLFAEVTDDSLTGIVKSQSSQELVYSCRLSANGSFGCCTQNLRPCGGLRGALCKHLLVLIVGLAKAGELDAATVDHWVKLSRRQKPGLDEEPMSATFLRYKGAEAGEIDWRPTETIPEDFYAM